MAQLNDLVVTGSSRFLNTINGQIDWTNILNTPTIPTVNNATLTIQKNGTTVNTFTANASSNVTCNITVPTTASDVGAAASTHTHGNIQSGGTLQTNDITIASGDKLVVTDSSDSAKVARTSISFDGSTATKCLTQKGTWESFTNNAGTITGSGTSGCIAKFDGTNSVTDGPAFGTGTTFLRNDGTWATPTNTKNTAGSTNTSSKIFLVGATSQAANPQTYSHDTAYVGTDGCLYSNSTKVSVEGHGHANLSISSAIGGNTRPVYFNGSGIPVKCDMGVIYKTVATGTSEIIYLKRGLVCMFRRSTQSTPTVVLVDEWAGITTLHNYASWKVESYTENESIQVTNSGPAYVELLAIGEFSQ